MNANTFIRVTRGPLNPALCESSYFAVLKAAGYRTGHLGKEHVNIAADSVELMWDVRQKNLSQALF